MYKYVHIHLHVYEQHVYVYVLYMGLKVCTYIQYLHLVLDMHKYVSYFLWFSLDFSVDVLRVGLFLPILISASINCYERGAETVT